MFSPMTGVSRDEDVVPMMSGSGFPNQRVRRSQLTASAVRFPVGQSSSAQQRKMEGGRSKVGGDRSKKALLLLLLQRLSQGATRLLESTLGIYFVSSTTESDYLVFAYSANRRSAIGFCVSVTLMGLVGIPLWISSLPWLFIFWDYLAMLWWTLCAVALWVLRMRFEEAASIPNDAEEGECQEGVSQGSVISGLQQRLRQNAWQHELCLVGVTFACVWFCVGLNGAQQSCDYIPLERRLVDCREAINTEGLIILLVLSMVYLIPARLILHVPLFVLWGVSFLGVVYVTVPDVIPAYFQSEVSLIVCEMVVAIGTLFVRERSRRRVFRLHLVREARSVELVKVREDMKRLLAVQLPVEVAAAAASSTTSDVLMTEQGISQSDTAEGDGRGTRRRASISHPTATATLHGHVQPWKMYKNAVVVTFRIDGLSKWCCRRGPCDVVELLKIVFDTLDAVWGEDDSQTPVRPIVETRLLSVTSKTKNKRGGPIRSRTKVHTVGDMYTVVIEEDEEDKQDDDATNGQQAEEQERRGGGGGDSATKISMRASGSNTTTTTTFRWMTESSHPEAVRGGSQRDEVRRDSSTMQQERSNPTSSLIRLQLAPIDWSCGPTSNHRSQRRPPLLLRVMECAVRCNAQLRKAQIHTRKIFAGTNNMGNRSDVLSPQLRTMLTPCDVVETRNSRGNDDVGTTSQAIRDSIGLCVGIGYGNVRGLFFSSSRTVGLDGEGMDQAHRCAARQNVRGQKLARWLDEDVGSSQEMQHVPLLVPSVVMSPQWMVFTTSRLRATNNKNNNSNNNSIVVEQVHQHGASASSLGACSVVGQPTDKREDVLQCIVSALQSADDVFIEEQNGENGGESLSSHSLEDDNDEEDADSRSVIVSLMLSVASPPHLNQRHDACEEGPDASVDATPLPNNNTNNNGNNASSSLLSGTAFAAGEGGAGRRSDQPVASPSPRVGLMSRQPVVVVPNISFPSSGTARSDGLNSSPLTRVAGPFMMEHEGFQLTTADHQLPLVSVSIVRMDRSTAAAAPPPSDNSRTSQQTEMKNPLSAPLTKSQGMSLASTSETTITLATTTRHEQAKKKEEEEELQSSSKFSMSVQWLLFAHFVDESIENRYLLSLEVLQLDEAIWSACAPLFSFTGIIGILAVYSIWNLESARDPLLWVLVGIGASLLLLIMALASQRLPQWFDRRLLLFNVRLGDLVNMILCHCCTISYCAAVFVTPSGNVLGDSQFIFLFIVLNWSMMRPAFGTRATTLWVTDFFLCIAFLLRTLSRPGSSWSRISLLYGEGIMVPYTLLLRMLIDQSRRKAFAVEVESESLKAEIEQDNKKLSELTRLVAPRGVSGRLLQNIVEQTKRQMQQRNKDGVYPGGGGGGASFSTSRRINDSVSIFAAGSFSRRTDHHTAAGPHTTQNRHRGAHPLISTDWSSSVWEVPFLIIRLNKSALEQRVAVETGNQQRNVVSVAAAAAGSSTSAAGLYNGMSTIRMRSSSATSIVVTTTTPPLAVDHNAGGGGGGGARSRSAQSTVSSSAQALDMLLERAHAAVYALIQQWAQPVYGCLEMIKSSPYEMRICVANMADERRKRQDGDELRCDQLLQFAALASRALDSWWLSVAPQLVAPIPSPSQTLRVNGYLMALTCGPMIGGVLGQHCVSFDMYGAPVYEALAMLDCNRFDMECAVGPHNETTKPTSSSHVDERRGMIFASYRFIRRCAFFRNWQRPILAAVVPPNPCATTNSEEMEVREEEEGLFLLVDDATISNSAVNGGEEEAEGTRMSMALKQRLTAAAPDATCLSVSVSSRSTLKCSDVGGNTLSFYVLHCSLE